MDTGASETMLPQDEVARRLYPTNDDQNEGEHSFKENRQGKKSAADYLIEIGHKKEVRLFHDVKRDGFAAVQNSGGQRIYPLRSRDFRRWLASQYYSETKKAANGEAISSALNVLEAKADFEGPRIALYNRFACTDGAIFIDLADESWRAIKVTPQGWQVLDRPPILFRRFSHQDSLPVPEKGGDPKKLLDFLNITDDSERLLIIVWAVVAIIENIPHYGLDFHGPQGAAKTTAGRMLRSILDPSVVYGLNLGRNQAELAQLFDHHAIPCFDNLGTIQQWQSDLLCRAITGGAISKRELFTDAEDVLMCFKRPIILNGINIPTVAPDLLDRLLLIGLERIQPDQRREESELLADFNNARPRILGGLIDALSEAMNIYPSLKLKKVPRMAD